MNVLTRDELTAQLAAKFPSLLLRTTEEFNGSQGGIWTSAEEESCTWGDLPLFNYYSQDGGSNSYTFGVNNHLYNFLEDNGWYAEFNDPGTVMLWEA
jgi:hypothetical protein